jgi:beta-lactamase regulating signal transducer with metallopeptidase domain
MKDALNIIATSLTSAPFPLLLLAKVTLVFALGGIAALALRRSAASYRHTVWALTIAAAIALPLGMAIGPAWRVGVASITAGNTHTGDTRIGASITAREAEALRSVTEVRSSPTGAEPINALAARAANAGLDLAEWIPVVWLLGALVILIRMVLGRLWLGRVAKQGVPLDDSDWNSLLDRERRAAAFTGNVRLLASSNVSTPLAAGLINPMILLPMNASDWSAEHRQVVLRHELAHIASGDAIVSVVAGVACAIYWFHPLAWLAVRRLRAEQEHACDDRVLALGTPAPEYAAHLLDVARSARALGMQSFVSVAMARPSQLEGRLLAVLNDSRNRAPVTARSRVLSGAIALVLIGAISSFRPVPAAASIVVASLGTGSSEIVAANTSSLPFELGKKAQARAESLIVQEVPVSPGGTLVLDLQTGASITITGSRDNRVRMHASLGGRDWRNTTLTLERDGDGARIVSRYAERTRSQSSSHHIDLTLPRRFNVRVASAGGGLVISGVEGDFSGSTGGGEIRIERTRGSAHLSTGGGNINVLGSTLSGNVSTGGGSVLIQDVTGGLNGSSGTGDVLYGKKGVTFSEESRNGVRRASNGRLFSRRSGGSVSLGDAPNGASIETGGGDIRIGRAAGEVYASTGGGSITIGPLSGSAEASTGAGDVRITVTGPGAHAIEVSSGNGRVTLVLPAGLSANLDLETAYTYDRSRPTRIESDWSLATTQSREWDSSEGTARKYVRARQTIGRGGATIRVKTVNGDIVLRRGG